jgi:prepilin-type processing-associated H-X9-DG protein
MAVAADRNPWFLSHNSTEIRDFSAFRPDIPPWNGSAEQGRAGNSVTHGGEGQNVLFLDGHVSFEDRPFCGVDHDNIYTLASDSTAASPMGSIPPGGTFNSTGPTDSVLVGESSYHAVIEQQAPEVDSRDLVGTSVLATLDDPLPEHCNAIWCATFQIAWDTFAEDLIKEPIEVIGAEELAGRLNNATFPLEDIEEESFYAAAGFVEGGIIEKIKSEMAQRFPSAQMPTLDQSP